jgi:LysR family nitrogen assimilation transcriptional regulator
VLCRFGVTDHGVISTVTIDSLQLRYFVEVATLGSINRAASRLNLTQSALSRRMMQLEYDLKVPLLTRSAGGVELTDGGRRLLHKAIFLAHELEHLAEATKSMSQPAPTNTLRLGMMSSASGFLLSRLVRRCSQMLPDVHLRVGDAQEDGVRTGEADLAIGRGLAADGRLSTRPLWTESLLLVAPKGTQREALGDLPFVYAARDRSVQHIIGEAIARFGLEPRSVAQVTPALSVKRLVRDGATSILPYSIFLEESDLAGYAVFPVEGITLKSELLWLADITPSPAVRALSGLIVDLVAELCRADDTGHIRAT